MKKFRRPQAPLGIQKSLTGIAFLVALAVVSLIGKLSSKPVDYSNLEINRVVDGDTVELKNGKLARYIGIDTPETSKKTEEGWVKVDEPYAQEAKSFNESLVIGKIARFEFDVLEQDKYKRLLVYCFVKSGDNEVLAQAELLRQGLAYLYTFPPNVKYLDKLIGALKEAKEAHRGIWSQDLVIPSESAKEFIGSRKIVSGKVVRARSAEKFARLSMEGIDIIIFKRDLDTFLNSGISPVTEYRGKDLKVFGLIKEYKGKPEIIVSHPSQIETGE